MLVELNFPTLIPCHHSAALHPYLPPTAGPSTLPWYILPFACLHQVKVEETAAGRLDGEVGERHVVPDGPHVGVEGSLSPWCQEEGLVVRAMETAVEVPTGGEESCRDIFGRQKAKGSRLPSPRGRGTLDVSRSINE
jgi:hypothetical protein